MFKKLLIIIFTLAICYVPCGYSMALKKIFRSSHEVSCVLRLLEHGGKFLNDKTLTGACHEWQQWFADNVTKLKAPDEDFYSNNSKFLCEVLRRFVELWETIHEGLFLNFLPRFYVGKNPVFNGKNIKTFEDFYALLHRYSYLIFNFWNNSLSKVSFDQFYDVFKADLAEIEDVLSLLKKRLPTEKNECYKQGLCVIEKVDLLHKKCIEYEEFKKLQENLGMLVQNFF